MSDAGDPAFRRAEIYPPFGLSGVVASAARLYGATYRHVIPIFVLFAAALSIVLQIVFLFGFSENLALPLYLLAAAVLPVFLASIGIGVISQVFERAEGGEYGPTWGVRHIFAVVRPRFKDILTVALIGGMIALAMTTLFGPLGAWLLWALAGPPILMQVVCLEDAPLQEAWPRTRELLKGQALRIFGYLLTIGLGIRLVESLVGSLLDGAIGSTTSGGVVFVLAQVLLFSISLPFLGAVQYACYRDLAFRSAAD